MTLTKIIIFTLLFQSRPISSLKKFNCISNRHLFWTNYVKLLLFGSFQDLIRPETNTKKSSSPNLTLQNSFTDFWMCLTFKCLLYCVCSMFRLLLAQITSSRSARIQTLENMFIWGSTKIFRRMSHSTLFRYLLGHFLRMGPGSNSCKGLPTLAPYAQLIDSLSISW